MGLNKAQRRISKWQTDTYRVYDSNLRLLYVGTTVNVFKRLREHKPYSAWYREADTVRVRQWPNRWAALYDEAVAIRDESPAYNVTKEFVPNPPQSLLPADAFLMWREGEQWWVHEYAEGEVA